LRMAVARRCWRVHAHRTRRQWLSTFLKLISLAFSGRVSCGCSSGQVAVEVLVVNFLWGLVA
jgi:hypothetical protein